MRLLLSIGMKFATLITLAGILFLAVEFLTESTVLAQPRCDPQTYFGVQHCADNEGQDNEIHVIVVDLHDRHIRLQAVFPRVSATSNEECNSVNSRGRDPTSNCAYPYPYETLGSMLERYRSSGAVAIINTDYFGCSPCGAPTGDHGAQGLAVRNGLRLDGPAHNDWDQLGSTQPSLAISPSNVVTIGIPGSEQTIDNNLGTAYYNVVAGAPIIVQHGQVVNTNCPGSYPGAGACSRGFQSAAGVTSDGRWLVLATAAMNAFDIANYLKNTYNVHTALKFDGGGSAHLGWLDSAGVFRDFDPTRGNRPVAEGLLVFSSRIPSADTVTDISNPDAYVCSQPGYINFESFPDGTNLSSGMISGVQFTTTDGFTWLVGDWATGRYNGKYPNGGYTSQGTRWAWLGVTQPRGRIDFPRGPASYFSLLTSNNLSPVFLEAYDANNNLLARAGPAPTNYNTGHMTELRITRAVADIHHVIVHDEGNFFLIDAVCTNAPQTPNTIRRIVDQTYSMQTGQRVSGNFIVELVQNARQLLHIFLGPFFSDVDLKLTRPDGTVVSASDPGVTYLKTANSVEVTIDNAPPGSWQYEIIAHRLDAATESIRFVVDVQTILGEDAPPTITISKLTGSGGTDTTAPFAVVTNANPGVEWSANEAGTYAVKVGGTDCATASLVAGTNVSGSYTSGTVTSTVDLASLAEGPNTLRICVTDAAGNTASAEASVTKDTTAPVVSMPDLIAADDTGSSDGDNLTGKTPVTLTVTAEADSTVKLFKGAGLVDTKQATGGTATFTGVALTEGANSFTATATDAAGNTSAPSSALVVTLDTTPPITSATVDPPPNANGWNNASVAVTLAASDALAGVAATEYNLDNAGWAAYAGPVAITAEGLHTLLYRSLDRAGNLEQARTLAVRLDKTAPEAALQFDPATKDLVVAGIDALSGVPAGPVLPAAVAAAVWGNDDEAALEGPGPLGAHSPAAQQFIAQDAGAAKTELRTYHVTDAAGNTLELVVKVRTAGQTIKARVVSLRYASGPVLTPQRNGMQFAWDAGRDGSLTVLVQRLVVGPLTAWQAATAIFDRATNTTLLITQERGPLPARAVRYTGMLVLRLVTDTGKLAIEVPGGQQAEAGGQAGAATVAPTPTPAPTATATAGGQQAGGSVAGAGAPAGSASPTPAATVTQSAMATATPSALAPIASASPAASATPSSTPTPSATSGSTSTGVPTSTSTPMVTPTVTPGR